MSTQIGRYGGEWDDFERGIADAIHAAEDLPWFARRASIMRVVAFYDARNPEHAPATQDPYRDITPSHLLAALDVFPPQGSLDALRFANPLCQSAGSLSRVALAAKAAQDIALIAALSDPGATAQAQEIAERSWDKDRDSRQAVWERFVRAAIDAHMADKHGS
jgi:hypothetical protein